MKGKAGDKKFSPNGHENSSAPQILDYITPTYFYWKAKGSLLWRWNVRLPAVQHGRKWSRRKSRAKHKCKNVQGQKWSRVRIFLPTRTKGKVELRRSKIRRLVMCKQGFRIYKHHSKNTYKRAPHWLTRLQLDMLSIVNIFPHNCIDFSLLRNSNETKINVKRKGLFWERPSFLYIINWILVSFWNKQFKLELKQTQNLGKIFRDSINKEFHFTKQLFILFEEWNCRVMPYVVISYLCLIKRNGTYTSHWGLRLPIVQTWDKTSWLRYKVFPLILNGPAERTVFCITNCFPNDKPSLLFFLLQLLDKILFLWLC